MSRAETAERQLPATLVRSRVGRSMKKLHWQDPDSEEPRPACRHADDDRNRDREYGHVSPAVYPDAQQRLCQNPGCFGDREESECASGTTRCVSDGEPEPEPCRRCDGQTHSPQPI